MPLQVIDDLTIDLRIAPVDRNPGTFCIPANLVPNPKMDSLSPVLFLKFHVLR